MALLLEKADLIAIKIKFNVCEKRGEFILYELAIIFFSSFFKCFIISRVMCFVSEIVIVLMAGKQILLATLKMAIVIV